jgi:hypothetical protein
METGNHDDIETKTKTKTKTFVGTLSENQILG